MQRSQFVRNGTARGITPALSASPTRTSRPVLARATAPASPMAHLLDAGVLPQQQMMQAGKLSSHALTSQYLARIRSLCSLGARQYPGIAINPDALKIALEMDRERSLHKVRGPLHGIPVVLRDDIATADRMTTDVQGTALYASCDAFIVARLRAAGAVIIGKSNLRQWAAVSVPQATASWAGLTILAVGSETEDSIVVPASACGLVAIKPTGLANGPVASSVREAAWLLEAISGETSFCLQAAALPSCRIGVVRSLLGRCAETDAAMEHALLALRALGAELPDSPPLPAASDGAAEQLLQSQGWAALVAPTCEDMPRLLPGLPHITVPAGAAGGVPVGLSFIGPRHGEARLLAIAYAYEQATMHRRTPSLPSSITVALR
ncbi:amidase family protein [Janthinobacterium sp. Mn2066]|uniref:amidase family protein n=1 Tax=Janthinobacterium sp. Mn2066 TaxID=3395264 RepID=UPI003BE8CC83